MTAAFLFWLMSSFLVTLLAANTHLAFPRNLIIIALSISLPLIFLIARFSAKFFSQPVTANPPPVKKFDYKRREFLKLIGSLGLGAFFLSLFKKEAFGMSFGSTGIPDPIGVKNFSGTGADYSMTLTTADTAYQCPESGNVPSKDYVLNVYNSSDTDVYWGWTNSIAGTSALRRLLPTGGNLFLDMPTDGYIYLVCGSNSKAVAYGTKERN